MLMQLVQLLGQSPTSELAVTVFSLVLVLVLNNCNALHSPSYTAASLLLTNFTPQTMTVSPQRNKEEPSAVRIEPVKYSENQHAIIVTQFHIPTFTLIERLASCTRPSVLMPSD